VVEPVTLAPALRWSMTIAPLMILFLNPKVLGVFNDPVIVSFGDVIPLVPSKIMLMLIAHQWA
jgi:hypothetical protein